MVCAEISQTLEVMVPADMTLEVFLSFIAGLIIGLLIILVLLIIRYRKFIITRIKRCCFGCCCVAGGLCYCCCHRGAVKVHDHADAYLLPSWEEPVGKPGEGVEEEEEGGEAEEDESLVLSNPINDSSDFALHVGESKMEAIEEDEELSIPTTVTLEKRRDNSTENIPYQAVTAETSFNEEAEDSLVPENYEPAESSTRPSFADILVASVGKQHGMLYGCIKEAIMKLESSFLQNFAYFVGLRVEILGTDVVIAEQATEDWKAKLLESCNKIIDATQMNNSSYIATGALGKGGPDMSIIMTQLTNEVHSSLNGADIAPDKTEELMTDFERDLGKFEMLFSLIYLQETKKLSSRTNFKVVLLDMLTNNMNELLEEMTAKHKAHIKLLEKLQMKSSLKDFSVSAQEKLARDIDKIWRSATRKFKKALVEQKNILRNDINLRMDRSSPKYEVAEDNTIQEKKEQLIKRDISMTEFIDAYCSELRELLSVETKQDHIEVNFTVTEFNALMEMLGVKYLKRAVKAEKAHFVEITEPSSQELVAQLEIDLNSQQASLRTTRQKQEHKLRSIMNSPSLGPPLVELYFDELKMESDFIQKMLEIQMDLSEMEQKHLKDTITARLCICEVQFELKKLKHERRLKNEVRSKNDAFSVKKEAAILTGSSSSARMILKLKQEEKNILTTHRKVVESTKSKLSVDLQAAKNNLELLLQRQSERVRRAREANANLAGKQERALNVLKSKLLEKISNSSATDQVTGERLLQEYHINIQVLDEELKRSKMHQEQVLQQKIQSRKLEKMEESKKLMKDQSRTSPYRVGSAKRFAADCLVSLLMDVRHKQNLKQLDEYNSEEGGKLKAQLEKRYYINSKLALQLREREMILKLASALNMSRTDLEEELKNSMSVAENQSEEDSEAGLLLTKSVLQLFETDL